MSIYYKYAPDVTKIVVLSYVDDCVYWYISESPVKWFVGTLGKRLHVIFLGYAHWFVSIIIYQMKDHSISVDQARYSTSVIAKTSILPHLMQVKSCIRPLFHLV